MDIDLSQLTPILKKHKGKKGFLIPLLQEVQGCYGYVPPEATDLISEQCDVPAADIYGVLTFYAQFYLTPRGKHTVKACQGTACYIMGGKEIYNHLESSLGITADETTEDGQITLETVACLGCCGMAPVVTIDQKLFGKSTIASVDALVEECRHS